MTGKRRPIVAMLAWLLSACSSGEIDALPIDGGSEPPTFPIAPHRLPPSITSAGGVVFSSPQVVTVLLNGDDRLAEVRAFGDWLASSSWVPTVGRDYGVLGVSHAGAFVVPDMAPAQLPDDEVRSLLLSRIADETLPSPDARVGTVYLLHLPYDTDTGHAGGEKACKLYFGFHGELGNGAAYVVAPLCDAFVGRTRTETEQLNAARALIDALTDPFPLSSPAFSFSDGSSPWSLVGGEVGDLCPYRTAEVDGRLAPRVWSNAAAARDEDPCIPGAADVSFGVDVDPPIRMASPGETLTWVVTGWSSAAIHDWTIKVVPGGTELVLQSGHLASTVVNNGVVTTLTAVVPTNAMSGTAGLLFIYSGDAADFHLSPVGVYVR